MILNRDGLLCFPAISIVAYDKLMSTLKNEGDRKCEIVISYEARLLEEVLQR